MCGRFIQCASGAALAERFQLAIAPILTPRYNVAPSQPVWAIRLTAGGDRDSVALRWGLVGVVAGTAHDIQHHQGPRRDGGQPADLSAGIPATPLSDSG
jgi:putative SOS response-associated peptidase YedK